ncbi:MAG: hypothetical protein NUV51_09350 [Sulfuricaulis sp.]|nr:hypothetical protein [Sulfuricaulis sp.]
MDERVPLATPWVASGDASIRALIMATRVLDAMALPHRTLCKEQSPQQYYYTSRQWTGSPASATQRLAWPRVGMFDKNGNSLDVSISGNTVASPTVITTAVKHGRTTGDSVFITDSDSVPVIDGTHTITVISTTKFSIPVAVTTAGTAGKVSWIPQALKDMESELAGQLLMADTTLDSAVIVGGIKSVKAGSVAVTFKDAIDRHVLPDAVLNLGPQSWFTDELVEPALRAQFDVVS